MGSRLAVVLWGIALAGVIGSGCLLPVNFVPMSANPYTPAQTATRTAQVVDVTTPLAIAAGLYRAAAGDCFTTCPGGTQCNPATRACERTPCGGTCRQDQACIASPTRESCVTLYPARPSNAAQANAAAAKPSSDRGESSPQSGAPH